MIKSFDKNFMGIYWPGWGKYDTLSNHLGPTELLIGPLIPSLVPLLPQAIEICCILSILLPL